MLISLAVFIISLIQSALATCEIHAIARTDAIQASFWAGVRGVVSFTVLMIMIDVNKWFLGVPYVAGDIVAMYIVLTRYARTHAKAEEL